MVEKQPAESVGQKGTTVCGPQSAGVTTLLRDLEAKLQSGEGR